MQDSNTLILQHSHKGGLMKKLVKSPAFWVVLILVAGIGIVTLKRIETVKENKRSFKKVERPPLPVRVVEARRDSVRDFVLGEGTVRAVRREFMTFEASGKVIKIGENAAGDELREGDRVYGPQAGEEFGQLLAQLDQRGIQALLNIEKAALEQVRQQVTISHAAVNQAENEYELAKADFERFTQHSEAGTTLALYAEQAAQAEDHVTEAEAAVAKAESDFKLTKAELVRTKKLSEAGITLKTYEEALAQAQQNLASATGAMNRANNDYELAKTNFEKSEKLHKDGIISKRQYDEARTQFLNSEAMLQSARANLQTAESQVKNASHELDRARINIPVTELASAQAHYQSAEAALRTAKAGLEVAKSQEKASLTEFEQAKIDVPVIEFQAARAKYLNAEAALQTAVANLQSAQSQVEASLARIEQVELDLEDTNLFAPFDGIITYLNIKIGDYLTPQTFNTSSEQAMMQSAPIVLIDPSEYEVTVNLPAYVAPHVRPGQLAYIVPSGFSFSEELEMQTRSTITQTTEGSGVPGTAEIMQNLPLVKAGVYSVSPSISPGGRAVQIKLRIREATELLKDGMFVTAAIIAQEKEDVLTLPLSSMVFRQNEAYIFVVDPETEVVEKRPIVQGIGVMSTREILKGLKEGELVVTEGRYRLIDGAKVSILNREGGTR